jgi:lysophospholipase L1-like esterase
MLCLGDSLTAGNVGYSYIKFLKKDYKIINKGVNGDTTKWAYNRLKKYINSPFYNDVDLYVVSIGTNDLFIPYLTTISTSWKIHMTPEVILKQCIKDNILFEEEYEKCIKLIIEHQKKIILIGLPIVQLDGFPNESVSERNKIIEKLAEKYNIPFIDTSLLQSQLSKKDRYSYSWKHKNFIRVLDAIIMFILPFSKDWLSRTRNLDLTVDGIHFNSASAKLISNEIMKIIETKDVKHKN